MPRRSASPRDLRGALAGAVLNLVSRSAAPQLAWFRAACYPLVALAAFVAAAREPGNAFIMLLAFLLVELFDSFSVLGGRLFGRRKLAPILSPKKTWEGLAFGLGATVASGAAVSWLVGMAPAYMAFVALVTLLAALLGDLTASAAKRRAGVKDYPAVLRIQGGLLDIADAWLLAAPLAVLTAGSV
jgi:phosphatidate cytidylyltransferase